MNSVNFNLSEAENFTYQGLCQPDRVNIEITFLNNWRLDLFFNKKDSVFLFNHVILFYKLTGPQFPNSLHEGGQSEVYEYSFVNSSLNQSYECTNGVTIDLGEVTLYMRHMRIEPFFGNRHIARFDTENQVRCERDFKQSEGFGRDIGLIIGMISLMLGVCLIGCCVFCVKRCKRTTNEDGYNKMHRKKQPPKYDSSVE